MENVLTNVEQAFKSWHDTFLANWDVAMETGDTTGVKQMAPDYYVTFFHNANSRPTFYEYNEAMEGMVSSVNALLGAEKKFENRVIRLKDEKNAIVFYEQVIVKDGKELSRIFTTEEWAQIEDSSWEIFREVNLVVK